MAIDTRFLPSSQRHALPPSSAPEWGALRNGRGSGNSLSQLQNQILKNLASHIPGENLGSLKRLERNDFTPEKVAGRIVGFVEMGLEKARARGASQDELQALKDQATRGAERGFREAREILSGLGVLNGRIAEDVNETERLTFAGLGELSVDPARGEQPGTSRVSTVQRFERAQNMELNITTRSGAAVSIQFNSSQDLRLAAEVQAQGGASSSLLDVSRFETSGYRFSVQGDLTPEEARAVEDLVRDVGELASEFFNGDVQRAFKMLPELRFDSSQLQSMDVSMTRTETYRMARAYEQTQRIESPASSAPARRLAQLVETMTERFNQPSLQFLADPVGVGGRIMEGLVEQDRRFTSAAPSQQEQFQENLSRLLDAVQR